MKARLIFPIVFLLMTGMSAKTEEARCSETDYSFFEGCVKLWKSLKVQ